MARSSPADFGHRQAIDQGLRAAQALARTLLDGFERNHDRHAVRLHPRFCAFDGAAIVITARAGRNRPQSAGLNSGAIRP